MEVKVFAFSTVWRKMLAPFHIFLLSRDSSTISWKAGWAPEPVCCYSMVSMAVFEGSGLFLQG